MRKMSSFHANRDVIHIENIKAGRDVVINTASHIRNDEFRPSFYVPPNPREVLLDFGLPLEDAESATPNETELVPPDESESATPEAKVLREILRKGVAETKTRIVSIYGKAGVGKSCILRGLGDKELQEKFKLKEHFPDGIYFLPLGMDATESTLIQGLAEMAQMCGGGELGRELRNLESLRVVLKKLGEWIKEKKCLVLFDDFWERHGLGESKVRELGQMFSDKSGSVLVMTTRFRDLARLGNAIRVEERKTDSEEAKAILLRHSKVEQEEIEDPEAEAFSKTLKMCGGLPLFLSIVGRGIAELAMDLEGERKAIWRKYWEELQALGQGELFDTENDEYPDLSTTLRLSLVLLSKRRGRRLGSLSVSRMSFQEMHRALCVFKKQARIPVSVCRHLWKVKSDEAAFRIIKWFAGVGLADIESLRLGEKDVEFLRVHDLVHMFAVECAGEEEGVARWHEQLLESYLPKGRGDEGIREWWNVCKKFGEDGYLFENVCRHLVCSGNAKEVEGLLVSGEWSKLRLEVGGLSAWKADFRERLEGSKKDGDSEREIEKGLEMVRDAMIESWGLVNENPRELGYQVVGRLIDCENEVVRRYLRSIEKVESKPWLKPMQKCCGRPGKGMMIGEFHLGSHVFDIALSKKSFTAVVGFGREVAILDLKEMRMIARCAGHAGNVGKVGISGDGKRAFSWSVDGTVRQWDAETGEEHKNDCIQTYDANRAEKGDDDDRIRCAAFSPENSFVVTGSERGKVKVWNLRIGERVGRTVDASGRVGCIALSPNGRVVAAGLWTGLVLLYDVQASGPVCGVLKGHTRRVIDIVFSADGRLVASCADDGTVRVWDVQSKTQNGDPLASPKEERSLPESVAFSGDGKQNFSAFFGGSIRVWDVANGAEVRSWQAHALGLTCVAVTGDLGKQLALSGGGDGTMRVWDLQATPNEENERIHHKGRVSCVVGSPDGSVFVSISNDKTLRIWNGDDGMPLGEEMCGHERTIDWVTVSPDSRRVVSASTDGTMRVWDIERRVQVGEALRGHNGAISCVGYSPNGEYVVSGSYDRTACIWRVIGDYEVLGDVGEPASTGEKLTGLESDVGLPSREALRLERTLRHEKAVTSVAVSWDGQRILSGLENGEIWVWDMKSGRCIDRKKPDKGIWVSRIEISETNGVVTTDMNNQELRWWLDNEKGLKRILLSEDGTGIAQGESQEGPMTLERYEVVCKGRIVQLKSSGQKIATLPEKMKSGAWAYNAQSRVLCVGYRDGRVLFFRVQN